MLQTKPPNHSSYRWSAILEHRKHPTKLLIPPKFQQLFYMALGICLLGISLSHLLYSNAAKHLSHCHCTIASKKAHLPFFLQLLLAPKFSSFLMPFWLLNQVFWDIFGIQLSCYGYSRTPENFKTLTHYFYKSLSSKPHFTPKFQQLLYIPSWILALHLGFLCYSANCCRHHLVEYWN